MQRLKLPGQMRGLTASCCGAQQPCDWFRSGAPTRSQPPDRPAWRPQSQGRSTQRRAHPAHSHAEDDTACITCGASPPVLLLPQNHLYLTPTRKPTPCMTTSNSMQESARRVPHQQQLMLSEPSQSDTGLTEQHTSARRPQGKEYATAVMTRCADTAAPHHSLPLRSSKVGKPQACEWHACEGLRTLSWPAAAVPQDMRGRSSPPHASREPAAACSGSRCGLWAWARA